MEEQLFMPMGMRKDFNKELITQEDSQYLYNAHNIRVITRGDETTGSIINEKGTQLVNNTIQGAYMGHATINNKVVVFTHNDAYDVINKPSENPEQVNRQGIDNDNFFYIWKLTNEAAKTFSGTLTISIIEEFENGNYKTLWNKILTKEEVLETFLDKPVEIIIGVLNVKSDNFRVRLTLSNTNYESKSIAFETDTVNFVKTIISPITYKENYQYKNIPVIINNNIQNKWEQLFYGGKIYLRSPNMPSISQAIQLSYHNNKPTIYWFDNLNIQEVSELSILVVLNPSSGNLLSREIIQLQEYSFVYGFMCNIFINPDITIEDENRDYQIKDRIYLVENTEESVLQVTKLFEGNLGFSFDYPIEAVSYYEGINIQKVYWTDGLNPTRVINIAKDIDFTDNTQFDFVPTLKLEETVQINKVDAASEGRAPGVIQYILTYVNKFLQESNPFFVSSLYYTSFTDRAGSPEDVVYSAFKLEINNPDKRFDYVKVYVVERTSLNGTPIINSLPLIEIGNSSSVSIIDSGANYISEDSAVLYPSYSVAANTINIKDYALFLGGIKKMYNEQDIKLANIIYQYVASIRSRIAQSDSEEKNQVTTEKFQLDFSSEEITIFKDLNTYRLGVQFQFKDGSFSQPYFVMDITKYRRDYTETEIRNIFTSSLDFTIGAKLADESVYDAIIGVRPLIVYPKDSQKKALYQGVLNPTVFNAKDRNENAPFTQPSWFFRPFRITKSTTKTASTRSIMGQVSGKVYYMYIHQHMGKGRYFDDYEGLKRIQELINGNLEIKHKKDGYQVATAKILGLSCYISDYKERIRDLCLFLGNVSNAESLYTLSSFNYELFLNGTKCYFGGGDGNFYIINGEKLTGLYFLPLKLESSNWVVTTLDGTSTKKGVFISTDLSAFPCNIGQITFNSEPEVYANGSGESKYYTNVHTGNINKSYTVEYIHYKYPVTMWGDDDKQSEVADYYDNQYEGELIGYFKHEEGEDDNVPGSPESIANEPEIDETFNFFREYKHMYQLPLGNGFKGEIQGSNQKSSLVDYSINNNFFIDASIVTFNSPDCELENIFDNQSYELNLIGAYKLGNINEKIDIDISSPMLEQSKSGFTPPGAALIMNPQFIAKPCWYDGVFFDYYGSSDTNKNIFKDETKASKWPGYVIYPWQKTGSLNNQNTTENLVDGFHKELSSALKTKVTFHSLDFSEFKYMKFSHRFKINYKVCLKENMGMDALNTGYLDDPITYYKHINTVLTVAGQKVDIDGKPYSGYHIYIGGPDNNTWLFSGNTLKDSYTQGFMSIAPYISESPIGYKLSANPVSMKYKSGNHLLISLNKESSDYLNILPFYSNISDGKTINYAFYNNGVTYNKSFYNNYTPTIEEKGDYLLCGEICNANPDDISLNDTKSETWFIGGKVSPIRRVLYTDSNTGKYYYVCTPNGIKWTEGDYFYQKYECLKTSSYTLEDENQIVEIAKFPCQCQVNLDGRYDRNKNTSFNVNLTSENFNLINPVYSQKNNLFIYRKVDSEQFNNDNLNNSITWSLNKARGAIEDKWLKTTLMSSINVSGDCGKISAIKKDEENNLVIFQDTGIAVILYNNQTLQATDLAPIELVNNNKVNGLKYISSTIGCSNKWAIQSSEFGIIFADSKTKALWKLNNSRCTDLSLTSGMKSWFLKHSDDKIWSHKIYKNFKLSYDIVNKDFYLINADSCLCYNGEVAISFYNYEDTPALFSLYNKYFCFKSMAQETEGKYTTAVHSMFTGEYNKFFGVFKDSSMTYLANKNPTQDKTFTNFEYRCDMYDVEANTTLPMTYETFSTIRAYNEYQDSGDIALTPGIVKMDNIRKKFRIWRGLIPRDFNGRDRIRNPWMYLTLTKKFTKNIKFELHDMVIKSI